LGLRRIREKQGACEESVVRFMFMSTRATGLVSRHTFMRYDFIVDERCYHNDFTLGVWDLGKRKWLSGYMQGIYNDLILELVSAKCFIKLGIELFGILIRDRDQIY